MTRDEFYDAYDDWYKLKDFCDDNGCNCMDDIKNGDWIREDVDYWLGDYVSRHSWEAVRDALENVPTDDDWYREDGIGDWCYLGRSDFSELQDEVADWAETEGIITDEPEGEADINEAEAATTPTDEEYEYIMGDMDCEAAMCSMIDSCVNVLADIGVAVEAERQEIEKSFKTLF